MDMFPGTTLAQAFICLHQSTVLGEIGAVTAVTAAGVVVIIAGDGAVATLMDGDLMVGEVEDFMALAVDTDISKDLPSNLCYTACSVMIFLAIKHFEFL